MKLTVKQQQNLIKPNFLCIGAPRTATTWLYRVLLQHPEISFPQHPEISSDLVKEVHFFDWDCFYKKGPEWYLSYFRNSTKKIVCEMTPSYVFKKIPPRIKGVLGNPKILLIVRNPIDRLHSGYKRLVNSQEYYHSFKYFIKNKPKLFWLELYCGKYFEILKSYLKFFPDENIMVIFFEDITSNPQKTLQKLFCFLGVKDNFTLINIPKPKNISPFIKPKPILGFLLGLVYKLLRIPFILSPSRKKAAVPIWGVAKLSKFTKKFTFLYEPIPEMDIEIRKDVYGFYEDDIKKFSKLVNRDLSHWR